MNKNSKKFIKAAKLISISNKDDIRHRGVCNALTEATKDPDTCYKLSSMFCAVMDPGVSNRKQFFFEFDAKQITYEPRDKADNDRVLALCFMAALSNKDIKRIITNK